MRKKSAVVFPNIKEQCNNEIFGIYLMDERKNQISSICLFLLRILLDLLHVNKLRRQISRISRKASKPVSIAVP